jgi:hypothetical protein
MTGYLLALIPIIFWLGFEYGRYRSQWRIRLRGGEPKRIYPVRQWSDNFLPINRRN